MKKITLLSFLCAFSFTACTASEPMSVEPEKPFFGADKVKALRWVESADPIQDAKSALKKGTAKLWVTHSRAGEQAIGLSQDDSSKWIQKFDTQSNPGLGDVLYGREHSELRKKFEIYAAQYNQFIVENAK